MTLEKTSRTGAPIFLVGFMGAGKTTVGRLLAAHLRYDFFDLDQLIEARAGKSVGQIFSDSGETEFRRLECEEISSFSELRRTVIALGGGAYVSEANRAMLRAIGKTVWLDCPLEVCLARIRNDKSRPLLGNEEQMSVLLEQRSQAYAEADLAIRTGQRPPEQLVIEIIKMLEGLD